MDERRREGKSDAHGSVVPPPPPRSPGDPTAPTLESKLIPYQNPKALTAYYLGIFSFIPLFGIVTGIAAVVLGVQGMMAARRRPEIRGKTHAWVGIVAGGVLGGGNLLLIALVVISLVWEGMQ